MINGAYIVPRVAEESVCRTSQAYRFTDVGIYKIHSNALMPKIPYDTAMILPAEIDDSIFINDDETKITFSPANINCQN